MYTELIKNINPKPKFNLNWYKNEDLYSEGEIEDHIIKLIADNNPEDYGKAIYENFGWSTYYHLTHLRKNILNWYPFEKNGSVLEIGCGMGAITNVLCEKCNDVTAVELSKKRAIATLLRCREKENLEIIVGNLNDIEFERKFDYITLIGVLEYQGTYTTTDNPYLDFLTEIKKLLKPNGKLLIAIENKYGLKYWCGAQEDHTGIPFEGMNQYKLSEKKVRTFSKSELDILVKQSGFKNTYFYYPMPDYKLPTVIYSEKKLPSNENMQNLQPYYIPDNSTLVADEMGMYKDIIDNGVFEFFANSFLVECSDDSQIGSVNFANISSERLDEYRIVTRFTNQNKVEKFALNTEKGRMHIQQIKKNQDMLEQVGCHVWKSELQNDKMIAEFATEELLEDRICNLYQEKSYAEIYKLYDKLYNEILKSSEQIDGDNNLLYELNIVENKDNEKYGPILKVGYLDMILRNAFWIEEEFFWFDQEWILEAVPAGYIFYRAIKELYQSFPWIEKVIPLVDIAKKYHIMETWNDYTKLESLFAGTVMDQYHAAISNVFRGGDMSRCIKNIQKVLTE